MSGMLFFVQPSIHCIYVPAIMILPILRGVDRHDDNISVAEVRFSLVQGRFFLWFQFAGFSLQT